MKAWYCDASCYDAAFVDQRRRRGGAGVHQHRDNTAGRSTSPASAATRSATGGDDATYAGLRGYVAGTLFEDAAAQVVGDHGQDGLTRARLLDALAGTHAFTAGGIVGPTDIGQRAQRLLRDAQGPQRQLQARQPDRQGLARLLAGQPRRGRPRKLARPRLLARTAASSRRLPKPSGCHGSPALTSVPGATILSIASRVAASRRTSTPANASSSCSIVRGPMIAEVTAGCSSTKACAMCVRLTPACSATPMSSSTMSRRASCAHAAGRSGAEIRSRARGASPPAWAGPCDGARSAARRRAGSTG